MIDSRKKESAKVTYIDCMEKDVADEANEKIYNDLLAYEQINNQSSDDEIDLETNVEIPDLGLSALITLLNSSVTIDNDVNVE